MDQIMDGFSALPLLGLSLTWNASTPVPAQKLPLHPLATQNPSIGVGFVRVTAKILLI